MELMLIILSFIAYSNKKFIFIDLFDIFIVLCQYRPFLLTCRKIEENSFLSNLHGLFVKIFCYIILYCV